MKHLVLVCLVSGFFATSAYAKPEFAKALGGVKCVECHIAGKFKEPNDANPLWKTAKAMEEKNKGGKSCNDCHNGKRKP